MVAFGSAGNNYYGQLGYADMKNKIVWTQIFIFEERTKNK